MVGLILLVGGVVALGLVALSTPGWAFTGDDQLVHVVCASLQQVVTVSSTLQRLVASCADESELQLYIGRSASQISTEIESVLNIDGAEVVNRLTRFSLADHAPAYGVPYSVAGSEPCEGCERLPILGHGAKYVVADETLLPVVQYFR